MSSIHIHGRSEANEPRRPLRLDFTRQVIRNANTAKQRAKTRDQFEQLFKEPFSMKTIKLLRTAPGLAVVTAMIVTSSVGVYALSNWFGGDVSVTQNSAVLSVDLSSCKGNLPPGVNSTDDRHNVQFKILGTPHISTLDLQESLLSACEASAVTEFYGHKFPDAGFSGTGSVSNKNNFKYLLLPARVATINNSSVTLASTGAKSASFATNSFPLAANLTVYNQGRLGSVNDLKSGDNVMFIAYSVGASGPSVEGTSILGNSDVQVLSLFKTRYNDGASLSLDYQTSNIMPLDMSN